MHSHFKAHTATYPGYAGNLPTLPVILQNYCPYIMPRAHSVHSLLSKKYKTFKFSQPWLDAFDEPEQCGLWFIWGDSGNGKTSFLMQLCKQLAPYGRVAYASLEEAGRKTFTAAVQRAGFTPKEASKIIFPDESIAELSERLHRHKAPKFIIIDSAQYMGLAWPQFLAIINEHPGKLFIIVSHADGKKPMGRTAVKMMYHADLKIWVEGYRAHSKGRYIGLNGGTYDIWPEGAELHWGTNPNPNN
jgi:hypothetical protein